MVELTASSSFKPVWDLIKDKKQVYIYGGMYIYLRKISMEQGTGDNLYLMLDFFYLSSKLKKTNKGACTWAYFRFLDCIEDGTIKPFDQNVKPLPTRIAGKKLTVICADDSNGESTAIVITAKGKIYVIEGGRKGWRFDGKDCNKWIESPCWINTSSRGTGISYQYERQGKETAGDAYHYGSSLREVTADEANGSRYDD